LARLPRRSPEGVAWFARLPGHKIECFISRPVRNCLVHDMKEHTFDKFIQLCRDWSDQMAGLEDDAKRIAHMQTQLPKLLLGRSLVSCVLESIAKGTPGLNPGRCGIFENEILLYLDPRRIFSIRVYFHRPGEFTPIHDHSSWGIYGTPFGTLDIVHYRRNDDGKDKNRAVLTVTHRLTLSPGEVDVVGSLDSGIHQTGNASDQPNVMISVYGSPIRRLFIRIFEPDTGRIWKRFPPKLRKRRLAKQALREYIKIL